MKRLRVVLCLLAVVAACSMGHTSGAAGEISLNVNGEKLAEFKPVIVDGSTFVPIRAVSLLPVFKLDWDKKTKTVSVTNTSSKEVLKLTLNKNLAYKGNHKLKIDAPPRNIHGSIYVPLRFIGESLDAHVAWDTETRTAMIYSFPENPDLESPDLVTARQAALGLPKVCLRESLGYTNDVRVTKYYFPYGQARKFFIQKGEYIGYFEVREGAAWQTWEGKITSKKKQEPDAIPGLVPAISKEWGKRPDYKGAYVYYSHWWMGGTVNYGIIEEDGPTKETGSIDNIFDRVKITPIDGEKRID
ncbi:MULTISPECIES: copper amine oxidase N-terminal domain-containing protein [Paenibacillus]|uniref:copper amine oxidase N-terminal domain-containing protein n=1 Tax=Paenibacillus TaxID=44249 RepID=UPI002FE3B961